MAGGFYSKAADTCQESCGGRALANAWMNKNGIAKVQHPILTDLRQVVITQREPVSSASTRSCWNFQAGKRGVRGSQSGRNIVDDIG